MGKPSFAAKITIALLAAILVLPSFPALSSAATSSTQTLATKNGVKSSTVKKPVKKAVKKPVKKAVKKTKSVKIKVGKEPLLAAPLLTPDPEYYIKKGIK
jgi:hypothetical protein